MDTFKSIEAVIPITFQFHREKAVEAAAMFLRLHRKPMEYLGLLKMLYIADRMALDQIDESITGDCAYSLDYGPVLSSIYDLIKGQNVNDSLPLWSKYICKNGYFVYLLADPSNDHLCEVEEEIIGQVYKTFGHLNPFTVAGWTHGLPEWKDPHGSRIPIVVDDVLRYLNKNDEDIKEIRKTVDRESFLDKILAA